METRFLIGLLFLYCLCRRFERLARSEARCKPATIRLRASKTFSASNEKLSRIWSAAAWARTGNDSSASCTDSAAYRFKRWSRRHPSRPAHSPCSRSSSPLAYIGGSLGTLVGADLLNLNRVQGLGAPLVSIGGAGTFDGIFLTGVLAVLIASVDRSGSR